MDKLQQEALELVEKLNQELYDHFDGRMGDVVPFNFVTDGISSAILLGKLCVWDSENCAQYDDEDKRIPVERHVRASVGSLAEQIRLIAEGG